MPTLFLDNNIWNYLVESNLYSDNQLQQARERLLEGVQQGDWEIVCSLPVLQEVIRVYRNDPKKYESIKNLVFEVVGNRWLIEIKERYVAELYNGELLAFTARYLDREKRRSMERLVNKKKDVIEVGDIVYQEGIDFKAGQEDARKKVFTDLGSANGVPPKKIKQAYDRWFKNDRDLEGWVFKVLEGGVTRKLISPSKLIDFLPTYVNCPSAWQYVDFRQAKILLNLGEGRAVQESDSVDADIYACSPYFDILVTEDQKFREAIDKVVGNRFEIYGFSELMKMLET